MQIGRLCRPLLNLHFRHTLRNKNTPGDMSFPGVAFLIMCVNYLTITLDGVICDFYNINALRHCDLTVACR